MGNRLCKSQPVGHIALRFVCMFKFITQFHHFNYRLVPKNCENAIRFSRNGFYNAFTSWQLYCRLFLTEVINLKDLHLKLWINKSSVFCGQRFEFLICEKKRNRTFWVMRIVIRCRNSAFSNFHFPKLCNLDKIVYLDCNLIWIFMNELLGWFDLYRIYKLRN